MVLKFPRINIVVRRTNPRPRAAGRYVLVQAAEATARDREVSRDLKLVDFVVFGFRVIVGDPFV